MGCLKLQQYTHLRIVHTRNTERSREVESCTGLYKYKFGGNEFQDELGLNLYDYDNRTYDPATGRFLQMDPLGELGRRWSSYNYCFDNPMYFRDPDGMWPWPSWMGKVQSFTKGFTNTVVGMAKGLANDVRMATGPLGPVGKIVDVSSRVAPSVLKGDFKGAAKAMLNESGLPAMANTVKKAVKGDAEAIGSVTAIVGVTAVTSKIAGRTGTVATAEAGEVGSAASKANTLRANRTQGANFEAQVQSQLEGAGNQVAKQVTIEAADGTRTRPDFITVDSNGTIGVTEAKSSATAPLTPNQKTAFPLIEQTGGTVIGNNGNSIGLPAGTQIPPTSVNVVRPNN